MLLGLVMTILIINTHLNALFVILMMHFPPREIWVVLDFYNSIKLLLWEIWVVWLANYDQWYCYWLLSCLLSSHVPTCAHLMSLYYADGWMYFSIFPRTSVADLIAILHVVKVFARLIYLLEIACECLLVILALFFTVIEVVEIQMSR